MAESDIILVKEEAREIMRDLEKSVPTTEPSVEVSGSQATTGAQEYLRAMSNFMARSNKDFMTLKSAIQNECANALAAIDDLHRQDQEIMALLKKFEEEIPFEMPGGSGSSTQW